MFLYVCTVSCRSFSFPVLKLSCTIEIQHFGHPWFSVTMEMSVVKWTKSEFGHGEHHVFILIKWLGCELFSSCLYGLSHCLLTFQEFWTPSSSQTFWCCVPLHTQPFWYFGPPLLLPFWCGGHLHTQPFWYCWPTPLSFSLVPWTNFPHNLSGTVEPFACEFLWCHGPPPQNVPYILIK